MAAEEEDDTPELLIKLRERKERHKQRNFVHRAAVVVAGVLVVCVGIFLSAPGVPGPGIVTILLGLGLLALEFDRAERWLERAIIWGDRALGSTEHTTTGQRVVATIATVVVVAAFVIAAVLWDIPLVPVL